MMSHMLHGDQPRSRVVSTGFVACLWLMLPSLASCAYKLDDFLTEEKLTPTGQYYDSTVPATLDLAERARLALGGLTAFLNPRADYAPYGHTYFNANPAYMSDMPVGPPNWGKIAESIIFSRVICGSKENLDVDAKTLRGMLDYITLHPTAPTPMSRVMLSLMALYQLYPDPDLKAVIEDMARQHYEAPTVQGEIAWYNDDPYNDQQTFLGELGYWMPVFIHGCAIRPLTRWSQMADDPRYLELSAKLSRFTLSPKFWDGEGTPKAVYSSDHGHFRGHIHAYTQGLMGLLWYADVANDRYIKEFVRRSYEYIRNFGIARIGLFGEGCTTGDMVFLAIKLTDAGAGDYWEDVDQYVRNHLVELQITSADALRRAVEQMPRNQRGKNDSTSGDWDWSRETKDNVIERNVGIFLSNATHPCLIPEHALLYTICCTGNCTPALYFAWEATVRHRRGACQVNVLLNHASPWLDVDSYLPYEGKVVIRNKTARRISVRVPLWVDKQKIVGRINEKRVSGIWLGNYLLFDTTARGDTITLTFPMVESKQTFTVKWKQGEFWRESTNPGRNWQPDPAPMQYHCRFRGNTLIEITPRPDGIGYPIYQRQNLNRAQAPLRPVTRYISPVRPTW